MKETDDQVEQCHCPYTQASGSDKTQRLAFHAKERRQ